MEEMKDNNVEQMLAEQEELKKNNSMENKSNDYG